MRGHSLRRVAASLRRPAVVRLLVLGAGAAPLACTSPPASRTAITNASTSRTGDTARVHAAFIDARLAFKRIEFLTAYYEPSTTRAMNGPALPDVEEEEGPETVVPPEGFQVIEELLFPEPDTSAREQLVLEVRNLAAYVKRLHTTASRQRVTDDRVFDATKLEVARVLSLGITGFDSPVALLSLRESAAALQGPRDALMVYRPALGLEGWASLDAAFQRAMTALETAPDFDSFDRLHFITSAANPLARALAAARVRLSIGEPVERRAYRVAAVTPFDSGAFDVNAFAASHTDQASSDAIALGRALFFDRQLSGSGDVSCASCHDPARAFTDGRARSASRTGTTALRNAPTILNAGLQVGSFYDLRTAYLEDQVTDVVGNPEEMHGNLDVVASTLRRNATYARQFQAAFRNEPGRDISGAQIRSAVAAYVRSLVSLNSRVDRAFRGDTAALTSEERRGLNLFLGKAKCGTCHFAPLFNGTVPPVYQESEVEVLGVPATPATRNARIDPDSGRFRLTRSAPHLHAFKTPTVRNAALTAPYMHNGVYRTLDEVVDFYNRGGGAGIGIALPNQTLPPDSLGLTKAEQRSIVRFMQALTDTTAR
jgi:cytochrome c peroxidase